MLTRVSNVLALIVITRSNYSFLCHLKISDHVTSRAFGRDSMRVIHNQSDQFYLRHLSTGGRSAQRKYLRDDTAEVQTAGNKASLLSLMKTIQAIHCYTSTAENKISY